MLRAEQGSAPVGVSRQRAAHLVVVRLTALLFQVIDASDVVIEVLDARDPLGCRCPQLEEAVLQRDGHKKLILVLSKIGEWTRGAFTWRQEHAEQVDV